MTEAGTIEEGLTRRDALRAGAGVAGGAALAGGLLGRAIDAVAAPAKIGDGPYGPLLPPDANGIRLPQGFTSRLIARTGTKVAPSDYEFHLLPDGMATYPTEDGGFVLVSNSEAPYIAGLWEIGVASIRFDKNFNIVDAYPILEKTNLNCAGAETPWGTWLSCEEIETGKVFECDPMGEKPSVAHPAMGVFKHEAAAVDPVGKQVYLTEDASGGCWYRFTPDNYPDLSSGRLDVAIVLSSGKVSWIEVPDPEFKGSLPTRLQVLDATTFARAEGSWFDNGYVYFATTRDDRIYAYNCAEAELEVLYDGVALGEEAPLHDPDTLCVSPISGDLYAAEDADDMQVCIISTEGEAAPFLQTPGVESENSELTGPCFDPTGTRFYFADQRPTQGGAIWEISGPFRKTRTDSPPKDTTAPGIKIRTLGKPTLRSLMKSGQQFKLVISDETPPVKLDIALVTRMKRAAGKGSRQVTIGKLSTKATKAGDKRIKVKAGNRYKKGLRKRDTAQAKLIVTATDAAGNRKKYTKPVRFT